MIEPTYITTTQGSNHDSLGEEIKNGLLAKAASISPKFLYDSLGSHLFTAITLLPEYYPTRTEQKILQVHEDEIAQVMGHHRPLLDLGAGNCQKAESLFSTVKPSDYVAIDISIDYLKEILPKLQNNYPHIRMYGLGMDFSSELNIPNALPTTNANFFYPGSSIGNFSLEEARKFLQQVKSQINAGGFLIGVDLMKEDRLLIDAYDDPLKLTSAFNLNILRVVNTCIDSNFDVRDFKHTIKINHTLQRVELYLEAIRDSTVRGKGFERPFRSGELIHTEHSHKYSIESIKNLLNSAGFESFTTWTDPQHFFALIYAS